jgi:stress-induced morphogen
LRRKDAAMPMEASEIESLIKAKFPDADVEIRDLAGDGDHYEATVVSSAFKGVPRVRQHQMVYDSLGGRMGGVLHALKLTTATK